MYPIPRKRNGLKIKVPSLRLLYKIDCKFELQLVSETDKIITSLDNVSDSIKSGIIDKNTLKDLKKISKQLEKLGKKLQNK